MIAERFFFGTSRDRSVLPTFRSLRQPESLEPIAEPLNMLLDRYSTTSVRCRIVPRVGVKHGRP